MNGNKVHREKVDEMLVMLNEAKEIWDHTLDFSVVADALDISKMQASQLCSYFITDEQCKKILRGEDEFDSE